MLIISPENDRFSYSGISFELASEMSRNNDQNADIESDNALFQIVVDFLSGKTEFVHCNLDTPISRRLSAKEYLIKLTHRHRKHIPHLTALTPQ